MYHSIFVRMAKTKTLIIPSVDKDVEILGHLYILGGNINVRVTLEMSLAVLKKLNIHLSYNTAITLLGIFPREMKPYIPTKTCARMFIAALFVMAKDQKKKKIQMSFNR